MTKKPEKPKPKAEAKTKVRLVIKRRVYRAKTGKWEDLDNG
jgi:hypothetical protein